MKRMTLRKAPNLTLAAALAAVAFNSSALAENPFKPLATYTVSGEVAEIIKATPDGNTLIYTDSASQVIGFVDITNPASPVEIGTVSVAGEPTSVAVTPDGDFALAVVHGTPDHLAVIDLDNPEAAPVIRVLGGQPDSIAISPDGLYAAIAIENERDETVNEGAMPQSPAGFLTIVDLVGDPVDWDLRDVSLTDVADRFPTDPEPEFIDINDDNLAAVTLQENNYIVIIDLPSGDIVSDFSAGSVTHKADLLDDEVIRFKDLLVDSRREPDAIHWTPGGNLAVANEGDYDLDVDFTGGRGFTIFSPSGDIVFESGETLEKEVAKAGLYDDSRSDSKGTEPEGIEIANYGGKSYLFVGMERAKPGAVAVYELKREDSPKFLQVLPTGGRPEGLLAIPERNLFVTANEGDGTISIFQSK
jgi:hypothetical protein